MSGQEREPGQERVRVVAVAGVPGDRSVSMDRVDVAPDAAGAMISAFAQRIADALNLHAAADRGGPEPECASCAYPWPCATYRALIGRGVSRE